MQQKGLQDKARTRLGFNFTLMNLLCPFIIIAAVYFLPFSHLLYLVQTLKPKNNGSTEVGAEELSLDVHLFDCLGGICGKQQEMINAKMTEILNAGNSASTSTSPYSMEGENSIIVMLNTLTQVLATVFGDDDNMRNKPQVRVFAYAGVIVILLLLIAGTLALISFIVLVISRLPQCKQSTVPQNVVAFLREAISCLLLCATVVYPATAWKQIRSSSLGSGYIVMAVLTAMLHSESLILKGLGTVKKYIHRKQGTHRPVEIQLSPVSQEANMII